MEEHRCFGRFCFMHTMEKISVGEGEIFFFAQNGRKVDGNDFPHLEFSLLGGFAI
jgi:hypothetical protein